MEPVDCMFGMTGPYSNITKTYGFTGLKVTAGCDRPEYTHRLTDTFKFDSEFYRAWGVQRRTGPFDRDVITNVTLGETEELGYNHEVCRNPDTVPALGELLLKTDYLMLPFLNLTATVSGKGELPTGYNKDTRGKVVAPFSVYAANGTFQIDLPEMVQRECSEESPLTDFRGFSISFGTDVKNPDQEGVGHMITLTTEAQAFLTTFYTLQRQITLAEGAPPKLSETITTFPEA